MPRAEARLRGFYYTLKSGRERESLECRTRRRRRCASVCVYVSIYTHNAALCRSSSRRARTQGSAVGRRQPRVTGDKVSTLLFPISLVRISFCPGCVTSCTLQVHRETLVSGKAGNKNIIAVVGFAAVVFVFVNFFDSSAELRLLIRYEDAESRIGYVACWCCDSGTTRASFDVRGLLKGFIGSTEVGGFFYTVGFLYG